MTRWFFIIFIAIVIATGNAVAYLSIATPFIAGSIAISSNLLGVGLVAIWLGSYYQKYRARGFQIFGHAFVMLAVGLSFVSLGGNGIISGNCSYLIESRAIPSLISKLGSFSQDNNLCAVLSSAFIVLGAAISWPSIKLYIGITSRSS